MFLSTAPQVCTQATHPCNAPPIPRMIPKYAVLSQFLVEWQFLETYIYDYKSQKLESTAETGAGLNIQAGRGSNF